MVATKKMHCCLSLSDSQRSLCLSLFRAAKGFGFAVCAVVTGFASTIASQQQARSVRVVCSPRRRSCIPSFVLVSVSVSIVVVVSSIAGGIRAKSVGRRCFRPSPPLSLSLTLSTFILPEGRRSERGRMLARSLDLDLGKLQRGEKF